jgi:hypothetical protein
MAYPKGSKNLLGATGPARWHALSRALGELGELEVAPARARAARLLRQLPLDGRLQDFALRVLDRQRETGDVVGTLAALAGCLESPAASNPVSAPLPLTRLPVWPHLDSPSHVAIIPVSDVAYAFTGAALGQGFVRAAWRLEHRRPHGVYVRVNRSKDLDPEGIGVLATPYRALTDLGRRLDPGRFVAVNQSIMVNRAYIHDVQAEPPVTLRVVFADGRVESLHVSRECWRPLKATLGLPARIRAQAVVTGTRP